MRRLADPDQPHFISVTAGSTTLSSTSAARRATVVAAVFVIALTAVVGLAISPASADPNPSNPGAAVSGVTDPSFLYAGAGADADYELMDNVASSYDATVTTPSATTPLLESYDSVNPQTGATGEHITPKPGCGVTPTITRPLGTGDGNTLLVNDPLSTTDGTTPCINFNRSSSAKATDGSQSALDFWTLGQDAVDWVTVGTSYAPRTPLTISQLQQIFTCQITDWAQVGGQEGAIHVYINPSTSGTYKFFLSAIGTTTGAVSTGCGSSAKVVPQVDGTQLAGDPQAIAPYAVTKWAGQKNSPGDFTDKRGGTVLGHIGDATAPTTTEDLDDTTYTVLNTSFANDGPQGRYLYNVTRHGDGDALNTIAANLFGPTGYICSNQDDLLIPYGVPPLGSSGSVVCGQKS